METTVETIVNKIIDRATILNAFRIIAKSKNLVEIETDCKTRLDEHYQLIQSIKLEATS